MVPVPLAPAERRPRPANLKVFALSTSVMLVYLGGAFCTDWLHGNALRMLTFCNGCLFFVYICLTLRTVYFACDEFQRVLLLRAFTWGTAITFAIASVWGHMEQLRDPGIPHLPLIMLPFILLFTGTAAKVLFFRSHRAEPLSD